MSKSYAKKLKKLISLKKKNCNISLASILLILVIIATLLLAGKGVVSFVLARSTGNSWDAGKWGKKADDQKMMRNITPTPTPKLTTLEDSIPPSVHINFPPNGWSQSTNSMDIRVSASDNIGISHVNFYVNGVLKYVDTTPQDFLDHELIPNSVPEPEYSCPWTPPTGATTYLIEAHAYDFAHNVAVDKVQIRTY